MVADRHTFTIDILSGLNHVYYSIPKITSRFYRSIAAVTRGHKLSEFIIPITDN